MQSLLNDKLARTAYLTALYRVIESERPDALFHEPFAQVLLGEERAELEQQFPEAAAEAWGIAIRTHIYDEIIVRLIETEGVHIVCNLAAGFDTRPYRMALPATLRWIEVDLPDILARKQEVLKAEKPSCLLERIALDVSDEEARNAFFARLDSEHGEPERVLFIIEGYLSYHDTAYVEALLADLHNYEAFHWLLTEFLPSFVLGTGGASPQTQPPTGNVHMRFAPLDGVKFFQKRGWKPIEFHAILASARRLKRDVRLGWLLRLLALLARLTSEDWQSHRETGGFVLLERVQTAELATQPPRGIRRIFSWLGRIRKFLL